MHPIAHFRALEEEGRKKGAPKRLKFRFNFEVHAYAPVGLIRESSRFAASRSALAIRVDKSKARCIERRTTTMIVM